MKIGFVLDDSLDRTDGVQQYVLTLGKWLTEKGHDVHYICGETHRKDLSNVHSLGKNIRVRYNKNNLSIPRPVSRNQVKNIVPGEFDVLHVQMPFSPLLAARVVNQASLQTAVIGTFHIFPASGAVSAATRLLHRVTRRAWQRFDACISVSKPAQEFMQQTIHKSSQVIPNPVNYKLAHASKKSSSNSQKVVFMGRLVERKGAAYLLKAFAALPNREAYELVIGGSGPLEKTLQQLAKELNIQKQTNFIGFVPEAEKFDLLSSAAVAVFPSTGGESFGISLTEAMAVGTVTLAGNNPGYAAVLSSSPESLVNPQSTKSFAATLEKSLTDKAFQQDLLAKQQTIVKQFDIEKIGPEVLKVYETTLHHKRKVR